MVMATVEQMKLKIVLIVFPAFLATWMTCKGYFSEPQISFTPPVVQLGKCMSGDRIVRRLTIGNTGGRMLRIGRPEAGCSCLMAHLDELRIWSGQREQVSIVADLSSQRGRFRHAIEFTSNCESVPLLLVEADVQTEIIPVNPQVMITSCNGVLKGSVDLNFAGAASGHRIESVQAPIGVNADFFALDEPDVYRITVTTGTVNDEEIIDSSCRPLNVVLTTSYRPERFIPIEVVQNE